MSTEDAYVVTGWIACPHCETAIEAVTGVIQPHRWGDVPCPLSLFRLVSPDERPMSSEDAHEAGDEDAGKPRSEWGWTDYWTEALCLTLGCRSWLGRPWALGYRFVCNPLHLWLWRRDDAKGDS